jgi:hypothetical protein
MPSMPAERIHAFICEAMKDKRVFSTYNIECDVLGARLALLRMACRVHVNLGGQRSAAQRSAAQRSATASRANARYPCR